MKKEKKIIIFAIVLILALGFFLRFHKIGETTLAIDEFLDINATYGYHKTGNWHAWDFNIEAPSVEDIKKTRDNRTIVYRWQTAQLLKVFPLNEMSVRLISIFWGMISIISIYFVGSYFSGKKIIGVLSAFFLAVNICSIQADRTFRMYAMFIPIFLLFSFSLFRFLEEKYKGNNSILKKINTQTGLNILWFIPVITLGLVSLKIHAIALNIAPVVISYLVVQLYFSIKDKEYFLNKYFIILASGAVSVIVSYLFFENKIIIKGLGHIEFFMDNFSYFEKIAIDYNSYWISLLFIIFGLYFSLREENLRKKMTWVGLSYFVILLAAVFLWTHRPNVRYLYLIKPFEIILLSSGVYYFSSFIKNRFKGDKKSFIVPFILLLLLIPNYFYFFSVDGLYRNYLKDEMDYKKIYGYVVQNRNKDDALITRRGRNYYWRGQNIKVYPIATDTKRTPLSLEKLQEIISTNPGGWIVFSEDDKKNIKKGALKYIESNLEKIEIEGIGNGSVYRWGDRKFQITIATDLHAGKELAEGEEYDPRKWKEKLDYLVGKSINSKFIIMTGDNQQRPSYEMSNLLKEYEKQSGKDFIWVNGNHDGNIYLEDQKYFYTDYGNWRMIALYNLKIGDSDGYDYECVEVDEEQMNWLKKSLETSKKKIVFLHCPVFKNDNGKKEIRERNKELVELFNNNGVAYVYSGHWHTGDFRTKIDNVDYRVLLQLDMDEKTYDILTLE
ncbi:MAG: metallophosphoesterase [Candidatus Moraniibacteriota bacterium]